MESQQKAYQDCIKRLDNLITFKTSPANTDGSLLSDEEYLKQRITLIKEKSRLEELQRDTGHRVDKWLELSEKTFQFACYAPYWFTHGDTDTKKEILSAIGSNLTLKDKKLIIEASNHFLIFEKSITGLFIEIPVFEPVKNGSIKAQSAAFDDGFPSMLRDLDSNQDKRLQRPLSYH